MYVRTFLGLQLIVASCGNTDLIRDYFVFKKINRVAGFSCGDPNSDVRTAKILNDAGMTVSLTRFGTTVDLWRFLWTQYGNLGVFLDLRCSEKNGDVRNIHDQASARYLFGHLHHWLILEDYGNELTETVQPLNESTFSIITDFVISIPNDDGYALYDVYNHCKHCGGSLIVTEFGAWTNDTGLSVNLVESMFARRWNYRQVKVKAAGVVGSRPKDSDLITYLQEPNVVQLDNWARFGYAVMLHISEMFNFTLDVIELNFWPKDDRNGPLMAGLKQRKYDVGFYPSVLTIERLSYADVMLQVWPASLLIRGSQWVHRYPFSITNLVKPAYLGRIQLGELSWPESASEHNKDKSIVVFRPFEASVWYTTFALSLVIILTLWSIWKLDKRCDSEESALILVAAICQQGLPFENDHYAGRIAFLQTMIFGLLLYNCYSAAMVSSRLNIPLNKMNDSLYSLAKSRLKLSARKDIFFNLLITSKDPDVHFFKKRWDDVPEEKKFQELHDGIRTIISPGHAYHANPIDAYPVIERMFTNEMICQLTEVHLLRPSVFGLWSARNSQFREIAKIGLIRITTAGIRNRQIHRWTPRKPFCEEEKRYVSSVTILETAPVIMLLIIGLVLSTIICVIENIVFRMSKRRSIKITTPKLSKNVQNNVIMADKKKPKTKILTTSMKK